MVLLVTKVVLAAAVELKYLFQVAHLLQSLQHIL